MKDTGRNRYRVYDSAQRLPGGTGTLQAELSRAIDDEELFLLYQPLFSLDDQSLVGVEALVRWRHPERGIVLPDDFIPFAEQHGLIGRIDSFVLDEACRQLGEWTSRDGWPTGFTMAVNVSGAELSDPGFAGHVAEVIRRHGIAPAQLCLEMTETAFIGEWGDIQETLSALSKLGVRLALDDFGTGYSSLAHLQRLRVDILKIDRSFVAKIDRSPRDRDIVAAVMAMSHALGTTVVGEGIETSQQLDTLADLDCDQGQGFLFAHPLSPEALVAVSRLNAAVSRGGRKIRGCGRSSRSQRQGAVRRVGVGGRTAEVGADSSDDRQLHAPGTSPSETTNPVHESSPNA